MSDTRANLRRKIASAGDLQSVVRTMKALAASNSVQYDTSVRALAEYDDTVQQGLAACFRQSEPAPGKVERRRQVDARVIGAVVFGTDQGLVGQFNEAVAEHAVERLAALPGKPEVWAVGERVHARLEGAGMSMKTLFAVPTSVNAIGPLVGQILVECEAGDGEGRSGELHLFYNRPASGALYAPASLRLLPLDDLWRRTLAARPWPTTRLPEVIGGDTATLRALLREYLFISLFRACAESLASENASRRAAMERADKNIDALLENFQGSFNRLRQSSIDAELFDVVSGFESLST